MDDEHGSPVDERHVATPSTGPDVTPPPPPSPAVPPAASPGRPEPPPPPPPSSVGAPPVISGWVAPAVAVGFRRLEIGSILGRTLDTLGREWSLFLVLAVPAALGALAQVLVIPAFETTVAGAANRAPRVGDPLQLLGATVIAVTLTGLTGLASAIATDRLWRGQPTGLMEAVAGVVRCLRRAVPVWLLFVALQLVLAAPGLLIEPYDAAGRPSDAFVRALPLLLLVGLPLAIVAIAVSLVVQARLSLLIPVIALEDGPARGVIPRTWRMTRGYAIVLFGTSLVVGLCAGITAWGATLFLLFGENRLVAGIALALAELVTAPLGGIWAVIAWGDLVGGRHADSPLMARGRGRLTSAAFLVGLGVILLVAGLGVASAGMTRFLRAG